MTFNLRPFQKLIVGLNGVRESQLEQFSQINFCIFETDDLNSLMFYVDNFVGIVDLICRQVNSGFGKFQKKLYFTPQIYKSH